VDLDPTRGSEIRKRRPAVVMTADGLNRARRTVVVVPLSTGPEPRPLIVVATPSAGEQPWRCAISCGRSTRRG
jgi:mRNA interferase MazF